MESVLLLAVVAGVAVFRDKVLLAMETSNHIEVVDVGGNVVMLLRSADALSLQVKGRVLLEMQQKVWFLLRTVRDHYDNAIEFSGKKRRGHLSQGVARLLQKYPSRSDVILCEHDPRASSLGYNLNKGTAIFVCLEPWSRLEEGNKDAIFYVILHELAHVMHPEYEVERNSPHSKRFYECETWLAGVAVDAGIFDPSLVRASRICGKKIPVTDYIQRIGIP